MDFYTPLFSKIVESSLWDEPDYVVKVFLTMLAAKDKDWVVRRNSYNLAFLSRKTEQQVDEALEILASPDTKRSGPQPEEGRRIKKVEDGWLIINGDYYQKQMQKVNSRVNNAKRQQRFREKHKSTPLAGEEAAIKSAMNGHDPEGILRWYPSRPIASS